MRPNGLLKSGWIENHTGCGYKRINTYHHDQPAQIQRGSDSRHHFMARISPICLSMNHSGWCEISCLVTRGLHIGDELLILGGHWYCACILETWRKSHNGFKQGGRNGVFPQPPPFDALLVGGNRARDGRYVHRHASYTVRHKLTPAKSHPDPALIHAFS